MSDWAKMAGFAALLAIPLALSCLWALDYIPQNSEWTCKPKNNSYQPRDHSERALICHLTQAQDLNHETNAANRDSSGHFLEGVKITDVLLAAFTGLLVIVGGFQAYWLWGTVEAAADTAKAAKASADASLLQARAAIGAELAEIVIARFDLIPYPDAAPGQPDSPAGPIPQNELRLTLHVKNSGRTRSRVTELCVEWLLVERTSPDKNPDPPQTPTYTNRVAMSHIFGIEEMTPLKWSAGNNNIIRLTDQQRNAINTNNIWLWVYGVCRYVDFMNDVYDVGFCAHWEAVAHGTIGATALLVPRGFMSEGPTAYIYRRKQEKRNA